MSVAMRLEISGTSASQNQLAFAADLGIDTGADTNAESLIPQIERRLGQDTLLEQSRWFVMSVMRHLTHADWTDPMDSNLETDRQYALAQDYIATDEFKKSLRTVLKDSRCKFTLVNFAKSRNGEKRILSFATKAFRHADFLLQEAGLVKTEQATQRQASVLENSGDSSNSNISRRAARRGYSRREWPHKLSEGRGLAEDAKPVPHQDMSEEEYVELDRAFEDGGQQPVPNWNYQTHEDRISLVLGIAAGFGVFVIVLWVFL